MDKTIEQQARELKSCPWCHPYGSPMPQFMDAGYWAVLCGCGAEGPACDTEAEAITDWNTRPAPSDEEVARRELLRLVAADPQGALVLCRIAAIEAKHVEQLVDEAVKRMARAALGATDG